jgi:hypothetical protein
VGDAVTLPALLVALPLLAAAVTRLPGIGRRGAGDLVGVSAALATAGGAGLLLPVALERPVVHVLGGWGSATGWSSGCRWWPMVWPPASSG